MNVEHLKALVEDLLGDESQLKLQQHLEKFHKTIPTFVGQPQQPERQIEVAKALTILEKNVDDFIGRYDPAQRTRMDEIRGTWFFSRTMIDSIRYLIDENPMTPAVVEQELAKLVNQRTAYLGHLSAISSGLDALGIKVDGLEDGTAEVGFQLPRHLFRNEFEGLIKELHVIRRIIRAFSELATGSSEPIVVRQISTTDPLFYFEISPITIAKIGAVVTWALHTWKQVEEIRKLRAETSKHKSFTEEEIEGFFGEKIRKTIDDNISAKVTELLGPADGRAGRREEQRTDLTWTLESILARVERGMTVDIRFLPPAPLEEAQDDKGAMGDEEPGEFQTLREIVPQLVFPAPEPSPVIKLPPTEPDKGTSRRSKATVSAK